MKRWERWVLMLVAGWVLLEVCGRVGLLLSLAAAMQPPPPFRVHVSDVRKLAYGEAAEIRCPRCGGGAWPSCDLCNMGKITPRQLGRPVVVVPMEDPTDYPASR